MERFFLLSIIDKQKKKITALHCHYFPYFNELRNNEIELSLAKFTPISGRQRRQETSCLISQQQRYNK